MMGSIDVAQPRVLVVEDEALLALEIAQVLEEANFHVLGPVRSVAPALTLLEDSSCDAAVLDINLGGAETSEPIALKLLSKGTPFVALSGYSRAQHPAVFSNAIALAKPFSPELLVRTIRQCITSGKIQAG